MCMYIMHKAYSLVRSKRNSRLIRAAGKCFQWLLACPVPPKVTRSLYFIPGRDKYIYCAALQGTFILTAQIQWQSSHEIQCQGTRKGWALMTVVAFLKADVFSDVYRAHWDSQGKDAAQHTAEAVSFSCSAISVQLYWTWLKQRVAGQLLCQLRQSSSCLSFSSARQDRPIEKTRHTEDQSIMENRVKCCRELWTN